MRGWLNDPLVFRTKGPTITLPHSPFLYQKIWGPRNFFKYLLTRAQEYEDLLREKKVRSQAELARKEGLTKTRITQILNLLKLAPEIQEYLTNLTDTDEIRFYTEKRLREITK